MKKKVEASYKLKAGDNLKLYLSDETLNVFGFSLQDTKEVPKKIQVDFDIVFEDEDILLVNKPLGMLSQKASKDDVSLVEQIGSYLGVEKDSFFKPAIVNRLDRNTSGIVAAGKNATALSFLSNGFKKREFDKGYLCVVKGVIKEKRLLNGLWSKCERTNKVSIKDVGWKKEDGTHFPKEYFIKGNVPVQTAIYPISNNGSLTLLMVILLTGKTHQIRSQLKTAGHPLIGDYKYGDKKTNDVYKRRYNLTSQFLHAYTLYIREKGRFYAPIPQIFKNILEGEKLWVPGIHEVFEDQHLRI